MINYVHALSTSLLQQHLRCHSSSHWVEILDFRGVHIDEKCISHSKLKKIKIIHITLKILVTLTVFSYITCARSLWNNIFFTKCARFLLVRICGQDCITLGKPFCKVVLQLNHTLLVDILTPDFMPSAMLSAVTQYIVFVVHSGGSTFAQKSTWSVNSVDRNYLWTL